MDNYIYMHYLMAMSGKTGLNRSVGKVEGSCMYLSIYKQHGMCRQPSGEIKSENSAT